MEPIIPTATPATARKKPRQRRAQATIEAIVEAAARILETQGLGGYNTNDIARIAGISIGSLYQYFPNKDAITGALVLREMDLLRQALEGVADAPAGRPRVRRLIEIAVAHQFGRSRLSRLLEVEEERLSLGAALVEHRVGMTALIQDALADLSLEGVGADCAAQDVIAIIRGMVDSAGMRGEDEPKRLADRITRAVLGYLHGGT